MRIFDSVIVVDWSGGSDRGPTPKKDAIWAAVATSTGVGKPVYLRNRGVAESWLADRFAEALDCGNRVLAGFDFPFGYPEGFASKVTGRGDPLALWEWFAARSPTGADGADRFALAGWINGLFPGIGPFWFNGLRKDCADLPRRGTDRHGHGMPERRRAETLAKGSFSCWQMGGAGAVGSQAMTGMASLARLRGRFADNIGVWPFQALDRPIALIEVWPSLIAPMIRAAQGAGEIKDAAQVRVLAGAIWYMQAAGTLEQALAAPPAEARKEEGWIFGLGAEAVLSAAAIPLVTPQLTPPRLRDDCFAMPQGVSWVPVDDALSRLQAALVPLTAIERLKTAAAAGRIVAADCTARRSSPPRPNSAVDGYGFAHAATATGVQRLPLVTGRAAAGQPYDLAVPAGSAIRILTGAILPDGVDTVVLEEDCATDAATVAFDGPVKPRANTRAAGEDVEKGARALSAGQRLRPPDLALLSALGIAEVDVFRPLRVGVLSTGDEIIGDPAQTARPHQIFDANRPMLLALAEEWGCVAVDLGHVRDDPRLIGKRLDRGAAGADVILTSGGASAGDEDHVSTLLRTEGTLSSWRIAMKPGRPLALALWHGVPVFGLPGNPVAALVCALIFARPALSLMAGAGWSEPQGFTIPAGFSKSKKAGRREYLRARINPEGHAEVFASEGSGRISGLSWATGLVELPDEAAEIRPGTPVRFVPYASFGIRA